MYIYNWITLLYIWNQHNIVNQLYSSIKIKKKMDLVMSSFFSPKLMRLWHQAALDNFPQPRRKPETQNTHFREAQEEDLSAYRM